MIVVVNVDDGVVEAPGELEIGGIPVVDLFGSGKDVHTVNDGLGDGEFGPFSLGDGFARVKGQEPVGALEVASGVQRDSTGSAGSFGVAGVVVIVCLAVRSKRDTTVCVEVCAGAGDDGARAEGLRNTVCVGQKVEPCNGVVDELTLEELGIIFERESTDGGTVALLDGAYDTFDFGNMLVSGGNVEVDVVQFKEWVAEAGKFFASVGHGDGKSAGSIQVIDAFEAGEYMLDDCATGDVFHGDKMNVTGDSGKESKSIDKEYVETNGYGPVYCEEAQGERTEEVGWDA